MSDLIKQNGDVFSNIRDVLVAARTNVYKAINFAMVEAYWEIGKKIEEAIGDRAEYGKGLLQYLSENQRQNLVRVLLSAICEQ
jgi:hypothetical protein